jgi:arginyl-tRNA--protein-N-Asp/Glu arginylyltransferase
MPGMPEGQGGTLQDARLGAATCEAPVRRPLVTPLQHFFRTSALPCPYLPEKLERKLITELAGRDAKPFYDDLCRAGFRRSHHLAYRPSCAGCSGCVPVRVAASGFRPTRSSRRIAKGNADITGRTSSDLRATAEQYRLFARYERSRHSGSEMAAMTYGDYRAMIEDSPIDTQVIEFRDAKRVLVGACIVDALDDGFSAVYSFFDPALARRSLGTFTVLWLVEHARRLGLPYVYLGYWIASSEKMSYKTRFRPLESLGEQGWQPFSP